MNQVTLHDTQAIAIGAGILGTGGDPYGGKLMAREAVRQYGPVEPITTEALRYGMRVAVLGPRAFGYDVDFCPLAGDLL